MAEKNISEEISGAGKTGVNLKRLWELAQQGKSADEIMNELNLKDMGDLKRALDELMAEKGQTIAIAGLTGESGLEAEYTDNGIRISPAMLNGTQFKPGDRFKIKVEGDNLTLVREFKNKGV